MPALKSPLLLASAACLAIAGCTENPSRPEGGPRGLRSNVMSGIWVSRGEPGLPDCRREYRFGTDGRYDLRSRDCDPRSKYEQTVGSYRWDLDSITLVEDTAIGRGENPFLDPTDLYCDTKWEWGMRFDTVPGHADSLRFLEASWSGDFERALTPAFTIPGAIHPDRDAGAFSIDITADLAALCPPRPSALAKEADCVEDFTTRADLSVTLYDSSGAFRKFMPVSFPAVQVPGMQQWTWPSTDAAGRPMGKGYFFVHARNHQDGSAQWACVFRE